MADHRAWRGWLDFNHELRITESKAEDLRLEAERESQSVSRRLRYLETGMEELMKMKTDLHMGQVACNFERDLACYIYPRGTPRTYDDRRIFSNLMKWLQENKKNPNGQEPNKRWDDLVNEFGWTDRHKSVFLKMVGWRNQAAHPRFVDLGLPIADRFEVDERSLAEGILKMAVELHYRLF